MDVKSRGIHVRATHLPFYERLRFINFCKKEKFSETMHYETSIAYLEGVVRTFLFLSLSLSLSKARDKASVVSAMLLMLVVPISSKAHLRGATWRVDDAANYRVNILLGQLKCEHALKPCQRL